MSRSFFIIDGHSQIWRAFYAQAAPLRSPDGEPTKATYIFTRSLMKMVRQWNPTYLVMACDSGREHLLRRKVYHKYKSDRKSMPGELLVQVARIKHITMGLGIPILAAKGYEADDIIATLVDCCRGIKDLHVVIVSRDKDLMQLVNDNVRMYDPMKEEWFDRRAVRRHWGVLPERVLEVQTLCGDRVDGFSGIRGIGPKTAVKLIKEFGTVRKLLKQREVIEPSALWHKLFGRDDTKRIISRNRQLASLCTDVPLDIDVGSLRWRGLDLAKVRPIFRILGFKNWE